MKPRLTAILCTHRPHPGRLRRALEGLARQTLAREDWELVLVDNASPEPVGLPQGLRDSIQALLVVEPVLGLSSARRAGMAIAQGGLIVFVDDDNVLDAGYLAHVVRIFGEHPRVGAIGGISEPEFERAPASWQAEFFGLLALRDLGPEPRVTKAVCPPGSRVTQYPAFAPIGAGLSMRREAAEGWTALATGRRGKDLTSGEDNDLVFLIMERGWEVGYFPELRLTHLIPAGRLEPEYLARLSRAIQKSWVHVLAGHGVCPWSRLTPLGAALRKGRAWFTYRAWSSPAARIRWQAACGLFDGRTGIHEQGESS
jgi:glycosyltransferase involved in cell wall biosynthesis